VAVAAEAVRRRQEAAAAATTAAAAALQSQAERVAQCEDKWRGVVKSEVERVRSETATALALAAQEVRLYC
jgi:hypothetical protein